MFSITLDSLFLLYFTPVLFWDGMSNTVTWPRHHGNHGNPDYGPVRHGNHGNPDYGPVRHGNPDYGQVNKINFKQGKIFTLSYKISAAFLFVKAVSLDDVIKLLIHVVQITNSLIMNMEILQQMQTHVY